MLSGNNEVIFKSEVGGGQKSSKNCGHTWCMAHVKPQSNLQTLDFDDTISANKIMRIKYTSGFYCLTKSSNVLILYCSNLELNVKTCSAVKRQVFKTVNIYFLKKIPIS